MFGGILATQISYLAWACVLVTFVAGRYIEDIPVDCNPTPIRPVTQSLQKCQRIAPVVAAPHQFSYSLR